MKVIKNISLKTKTILSFGLLSLAILTNISMKTYNSGSVDLGLNDMFSIQSAHAESESKCNYIKRTNSSCKCKGTGTVTCTC